jgi:hypothetical protein
MAAVEQLVVPVAVMAAVEQLVVPVAVMAAVEQLVKPVAAMVVVEQLVVPVAVMAAVEQLVKPVAAMVVVASHTNVQKAAKAKALAQGELADHLPRDRKEPELVPVVANFQAAQNRIVVANRPSVLPSDQVVRLNHPAIAVVQNK